MNTIYDDIIKQIGDGPERVYDLKVGGIRCSYYEERPNVIREAERVASYYKALGFEAKVSVDGLHVHTIVSK